MKQFFRAANIVKWEKRMVFRGTDSFIPENIIIDTITNKQDEMKTQKII